MSPASTQEMHTWHGGQREGAGSRRWNRIEGLDVGLRGPEGNGKSLKQRQVQMGPVRNVPAETVWDWQQDGSR